MNDKIWEFTVNQMPFIAIKLDAPYTKQDYISNVTENIKIFHF